MSRFLVALCTILLLALPVAAQTVFDVSPNNTFTGEIAFADSSRFTSTGLTMAPASSLIAPDLSSWTGTGLAFATASQLTLPGASTWTQTQLTLTSTLQLRGPDASTWNQTGFSVGAGKQFYLADGTSAAPALTFGTEATTGLYRAAAADLRVMLAGGIQALRLFKSGTTGLVSIPLGASSTTANLTGTVCKAITSSATTGTTLQTLASCALPANALSLEGMGLKVKAWGITAANANSKTFALAFGATTCATLTGAVNNGSIVLETTVLRTGAATQECGGTGISSIPTSMATRGAPAETLSGALTLTAQATTPTASGDFTFKGMTVEVLN